MMQMSAVKNDKSDTAPAYLTEAEAGKILRRGPSAIKRLRLSGKLAYLTGRPVLIREDWLQAYLDSIKVQVVLPEPEPSPSEAKQLARNEEARQRAVQMTLKRNRRRARKAAPKP